MADVIDFTKFKQKQSNIDERKLTAELVKEYKDVILLVAQHGDSLTKEDWIHAYGMMLNFNPILMTELNKHLEE